jgi:hypothetical protein
VAALLDALALLAPVERKRQRLFLPVDDRRLDVVDLQFDSTSSPSSDNGGQQRQQQCQRHLTSTRSIENTMESKAEEETGSKTSVFSEQQLRGACAFELQFSSCGSKVLDSSGGGGESDCDNNDGVTVVEQSDVVKTSPFAAMCGVYTQVHLCVCGVH